MKHSRNLQIGVGGRKCNCCFPAPGSKARRLMYRAAKHKDAKDALKAEEINGIPIDTIHEWNRWRG